MKWGIQYQTALREADSFPQIYGNGFSNLEVPYEMLAEYTGYFDACSEEEKKKLPAITGVGINGNVLTAEVLFDALQKAQARGVSYLVVHTADFASEAMLSEVVEQCAGLIHETGIEIYLENGYLTGENGAFCCSFFSEISKLKRLAEGYNRICDKDCFGLSMHVGYANLLGKNLRGMVEDAGELLKLIHINDNDGLRDAAQLPFTFTRGRGARTTDWYRLIGALVRSDFRGWCIWNITGLFHQAPQCLYPSFFTLMKGIMQEWEEQLLLEKRLDQQGKKLILFGTGAMAYNFMCEWSHRYPPAFFVDNNSSLWNTEQYGVPVKAPEAILEIPPEERNVWICNRYYEQIGLQLTGMGIDTYYCYNDNYYM